MAIIYANENNPATLKLLIGRNIAKVDAEIKIVNIYDRSTPQPKHLPCLEVKEDHVFFIPNAALCYFCPPTVENSSKVYDWLEWEANVLSPCLSIQQGSSVKSVNVRKELESALQMLNENLIGRKYLIGNTITSADIAIWSTLYPLQQDGPASKEYLTLLDNIKNWLRHLENEPQFKDALSNYKIDAATAYNSLLIGSKLITSERFDKKELDKHNNALKESPQHIVEAVTSEELEAAKKAWVKSISQLPKLKEPTKNVLPLPGEKNVFVTSALPYVNNVPHLGNIIGCVLSADVFARFSRLCNYNTLFICGTDEYGTATETKALEERLTCQEICDKYFKIHNDIYKWFNISFDHFGRTSNPEQTELCHDLFLQLNANGFMFTQSVEQLHCEKCDRYLADRFVEGGCPNVGCDYEDARGDQCDGCGKLVNAIELKNPRCKICRNTPKLKISNQFFIDLPKLEPLLHHWMKISSPSWSHNAQVIAKSWLKEGLKPRCITRDLKWGVPVPLDGYRNKVFYVWFDAPIGYMSISKAYSKDFSKWWLPTKDTDINLYQFMAKDNVPFHSVLFPAMLLGANRGYVTNTHIMATEYLNYEDGKFSKSRGVGVFGNDAQDTGILSDVWRFYLLYIRPESQDSSFSWDDLVTKNNSELLNNLGNFINRTLVFAKNNFNKTVPPMELTSDDYTLLAFCNREYKAYVAALTKAKLRDGIRHILAISRHGNQYMQANQPWVLHKGSDQERLRAGTVIGVCCNLVCLLATLLSPYLPETSASLKKQLNSNDMVIIPSNPEIVTLLPVGHKLGEPSPLFAKIETDQIKVLKKRFAGPQNGRETRPQTDDFKAIEAKVTQQADKVRVLKSSGAAKSLWQPEVAILLDLKKQLEAAQKTASTQEASVQTPLQNGNASPEEITILEDEVTKQGLIVRKLKEAGALKTEWQPEVEKLLVLKNQLAVLLGVPMVNSHQSKRGKSKA